MADSREIESWRNAYKDYSRDELLRLRFEKEEFSAERIAAEWTDRGDKPMIAAQVKVFVDQLAERGLIE